VAEAHGREQLAQSCYLIVTLPEVKLFCPVCFVLSITAQVIAWKDPSPKWPVRCRAGCKTLLTQKLNSQLLGLIQQNYTCTNADQLKYLDITDMQILFQNGDNLLVKLSSGKTTFVVRGNLLQCRLSVQITDNISQWWTAWSSWMASRCRCSSCSTSKTWRNVPVSVTYVTESALQNLKLYHII